MESGAVKFVKKNLFEGTCDVFELSVNVVSFATRCCE